MFILPLPYHERRHHGSVYLAVVVIKPGCCPRVAFGIIYKGRHHINVTFWYAVYVILGAFCGPAADVCPPLDACHRYLALRLGSAVSYLLLLELHGMVSITTSCFVPLEDNSGFGL